MLELAQYCKENNQQKGQINPLHKLLKGSFTMVTVLARICTHLKKNEILCKLQQQTALKF
jgi:hypothetical protein